MIIQKNILIWKFDFSNNFTNYFELKTAAKYFGMNLFQV